jgi:hypothetical protein
MRPRTVDELLDSFLDIGPTIAPQRIAAATRVEIRTARQRPAVWPVWSFAEMNAFTKLAIAVAALVVIVGIGINLLPGRGGVGGPLVSPSPTQSPSPTPQPSPTPRPPDVLDDLLVADGRYSVTVQGIPLSFSIPAPSWESHGRPYISKSTQGPQGAEAIIYWASFPDGLSAHPCAPLLNPSIGQSAVELAAAVSAAPGTELIAGPSDVTVGGRAAKHVVLTVREDIGCDPGFFYTWEPFDWGALWPGTTVGDTIRVWVVDVDGTLLFIAGETNPDASARVRDEIEQMVESIRFE